MHRPHLLEAWGQRFNLQIDDPHLTPVPATPTCPAWSAASARCLGEHGINISAAAVGRQADEAPHRPRGDGGHDRRPRPGRGRRADRGVRRLRQRPLALALDWALGAAGAPPAAAACTSWPSPAGGRGAASRRRARGSSGRPRAARPTARRARRAASSCDVNASVLATPDSAQHASTAGAYRVRSSPPGWRACGCWRSRRRACAPAAASRSGGSRGCAARRSGAPACASQAASAATERRASFAGHPAQERERLARRDVPVRGLLRRGARRVGRRPGPHARLRVAQRSTSPSGAAGTTNASTPSSASRERIKTNTPIRGRRAGDFMSPK